LREERLLLDTVAERLGNIVARNRAEDALKTYQNQLHDMVRKRTTALDKTLCELREAHESLKNTQLQLIQAEKMQSVGLLAAGVSHEVINPLAIILMGIEYLSNIPACMDEHVHSVLQRMRNAINRADSIVKGLLDFSSIDSAHYEMENINDIIDEAVSYVRHECDKHHVTVMTELSDKVHEISLDKNMITQLFVNILLNALQSMPTGGTLTIRTYEKQLSEKYSYGTWDYFAIGEDVLWVEVEDTGTGIPEEIIAKVFDPFFTTKPTGKGTGLGLSVANRIIELHKGVITIKNRKEGGRKNYRGQSLYCKADNPERSGRYN